MSGWIRLHRKILENPIVCKDTEYFFVWCYLLLNATHTEMNVVFNGKKIKLRKGQLITGRKAIAEKINISQSKVQRILKTFEIDQQIEQQTTPRNRLITIVRWKEYQPTEQQNEQQLNNKRTTTEQQLNTNNNVIKKECNKEKNNPSVSLSVSKITNLSESIDEDLEKIKQNCNIHLYSEPLRLFIKKILDDLWYDGGMKTKLKMRLTHKEIKKRLQLCETKHVDIAIAKMEGCTTNKEIYFAKCLLTAIVERSIDELFEEEG